MGVGVRCGGVVLGIRHSIFGKGPAGVGKGAHFLVH